MSTRAIKIYADYTAEQVKREEARKASLEARGLAVVTTSGALATLLLGLAALSERNLSSKGTFVLPESAHSWLRAALVFFALAAFGAILTNFPVVLQYADPEDLKGVLSSDTTEAQAEQDVADNAVLVLESLQLWNGRKGKVLFAAMLFEAVAIAFVAIAVWNAL